MFAAHLIKRGYRINCSAWVPILLGTGVVVGYYLLQVRALALFT